MLSIVPNKVNTGTVFLIQADYILGKNPKAMSYLVGYGPKYPIHVHHRGASIASKFVLNAVVGCVQGFDSWYRSPGVNPNVIYGALVGGPDRNDAFSDDRSDYEQTEPTISACAPLVGLFSKLQSTMNGIPGEYFHRLILYYGHICEKYLIFTLYPFHITGSYHRQSPNSHPTTPSVFHIFVLLI